MSSAYPNQIIAGSQSMLGSVPTLEGQPEVQRLSSKLSTNDNGPPQELQPQWSAKKGFRFWMTFLAMCVSLFLSALEVTAVAVALPTIVSELHGEDFVWVASAYALASTALLPLSGGCAEIFGRRITVLISLALFALGSALCGAAQNLNWLIAARTIQGAGGGGVITLANIVVSDLVPLKERGTYQGVVGMTWGCALSIGPLVGGALAERGQWRWLFYLNLPCCGLAAILVIAFLNLKTPGGSLREKLLRVDWIGSVIIVASSSACMLALTWGGSHYPWSSPKVLAPLVLGLFGMGLFLAYEALLASNPIVPWSIVSNRTSLSGYIQTFISPIPMLAVTYFLPTYFQACKGASPIQAGIYSLPGCVAMGVFLLITGVTVKVTKKYRVQLWTGWVIFMVIMGALTTLHLDTPLLQGIWLPLLTGVGSGIIYSSTYYPVLAPLPVSQNAYALSFLSFCRQFAGVWGVSIGTAIVQTQLGKRLPADFISRFPQGVSITYAAIPVLDTLPEPLRTQVRDAFAESIIVIWQVMIGITGIGLVASAFMKALPLHGNVDEKWGIERTKANDGVISEKPSSETSVSEA